jgi:glutaconate CoA-transferase subunit A
VVQADGDGDKRTTVDDIVGELRSGMTIGIGGWGSRRKPMASCAPSCRSDLTDLTVVAYGGPDVGLLCATGKVRKVVCGFVTLDSIALDPHWRVARQQGQVEVMEVDEGMFFQGLQAAAWRVPFLPTRAGLGSDVLTINPTCAWCAPPTAPTAPSYDPADAESSWSPCRPSTSMPPSSTPTGPTPPATGRSSARPLLRPAVPRRRRSPLRHHRAHRGQRHPRRRGTRSQRVCHPSLLTDGVAETPGGAHFTANPPDYGRDEAFQKEYAAAAGDPEAWEAFASATWT